MAYGDTHKTSAKLKPVPKLAVVWQWLDLVAVAVKTISRQMTIITTILLIITVMIRTI